MGIQRKRTRLLDAYSGNGIENNAYNQKKLRYYSFKGYEETLDENHYWATIRRVQQHRQELRTVDVGGEFTHSIATVKNLSPIEKWGPVGGYGVTWNGPLHAWYSTLDFKSDPNPWRVPGATSDSEMDRLGSTAISRVSPVNPHVDLITSLGELYRDGIPALPGVTSKKDGLSAASLGGEYLNYQFGIAPMISDLQSIAKTAVHAEKLIRQYQRDSGRLIRRRYDFPVDKSSDTVVLASSGYPMNGPQDLDFWRSPGKVMRTTETEVKTWFSGAFMYYADVRSVGPLMAFIKQAQHITGLRLDYESYYNLAPWSWAIDWFTNLGDVINNVTMFAEDGLIMPWGYVMRETTRTTTYWLDGCRNYANKPITAEQVLKLKHQRRRRATPFGFGLTHEQFTPRQWAILAALGLSKSGRYTAM